MQRREFLIVVKKDGTKFLAPIPTTIYGGDQLLYVREVAGSQVPEAAKWTVNGFTSDGPIITIDEELGK